MEHRNGTTAFTGRSAAKGPDLFRLSLQNQQNHTLSRHAHDQFERSAFSFYGFWRAQFRQSAGVLELSVLLRGRLRW